MAVTTPSTGKPTLPTEEVRLAMGWNGGVSLAIWMGGIAVELDCARRAHLQVEEDPAQPRNIYAALCAAFDRKLVLDIFAGASAGGLNSALLGAAIFSGRRLHPDFLRDKWIAIGDLSLLLQPTNKSAPTSVMQGDLFAAQVGTTFRELMAPPVAKKGVEPPPDLCALPADQAAATRGLPLLDIQTTNVIGKQRGFLDAWGRELYAREYRAPFRFRKPADFTPETLAAAARASASFPAAFEPSPLTGDALRVTRLRDDPEALWNPEVAARDKPIVRYAIDGGLLENAPIRQAIDLIPSRPASGPVTRFVVYVNANPSRFETDKPEPGKPDLRDVLAYVVSLPRVGRDVDQIDAITNAKRRSEKNSDTLDALLDVSHDSLVATAKALFVAYRKRRAYGAYDDILGGGEPVRIEVVNDLMAATHDGALLPWFPASFAAPTTAAQWNWGFRAAQRILYLQLDLLGEALKASFEAEDGGGSAAPAIYAGRTAIDEAIAKIEAAYRKFLAFQGLAPSVAALRNAFDDSDEAEDIISVLGAIYDGYRVDHIWEPLHEGTKSFYDTARTVATSGAFPRFADLFGAPEGQDPPESLQDDGFNRFVERALAIEVVRRAFVDDGDVDAAQDFKFAQLAPNAPVRLFTRKPIHETGPADGEAKLTGIRLGHFAGFYRSSWRANDFMWGRLDGATRIVDILVDPCWQRRLPPGAAPWVTLAATLVPTGSSHAERDLRALAREALDDAALESADVDPAVASYLQPALAAELEAGDLRAHVAAVLERDLTAADEHRCGFVTRVMLGRAAQYETLRAELTVLSQRVVRDREEGASTKPFSWQLEGSLMDVIDELRSYEDEDALPARLGRDSPDESTSALALRTVSHVALVTLSALPGLAMPLGRVTTPLRLPFLSVAGTAGKSLLANLAVVFSFGAATWYLATRVITADNNRINEARAAALAAPPGKHLHYAHPVYLGELRSPAVLAMLISALVVLGVLLVPAARTFRSSRRLKNLAWGLALLATAGAIPFVFGWRDSGLAVTLTGSGGFRPTGTVLELMFAAAAVGAVGSKITPLIGYIKKLRDARTWTVSALAIAASIFLLVWSAPHLLHAFNDGRWYSWHRASALAALLSMPVLVMYAFAVSWARATAVALGATRKSPPVRLARRVKSRFAGDAPVGQREG